MKLIFHATAAIQTYHDNPSWTEGTIREIDDDRGVILMKDFPENFAPATESVQAEKASGPVVSAPTPQTPEVTVNDLFNRKDAKKLTKAGITTADQVEQAKTDDLLNAGFTPEDVKRLKEAAYGATHNRAAGPDTVR